MEKNKIVITASGLSGSGKSTLLKEIETLLVTAGFEVDSSVLPEDVTNYPAWLESQGERLAGLVGRVQIELREEQTKREEGPKRPPSDGKLRKYSVNATVIGGKHLGFYMAKSPKEAIEKALKKDGGVSLCRQCVRECENAELENVEAELVEDAPDAGR